MGIRRSVWSLIILVCIIGCSKDSPLRVELGNAGDAAKSILSDERYDKIVLEIAYASGFRPTDVAVNATVDFLETLCNKPGGVRVVFNELSLSAGTRGARSIRSVEDDHRATKAKKDELSLWIFFNNGGHPSDNANGSILGVAYASTSIGIYEKTIRDNTGGIFGASLEDVETTVIQHELGHLMGLVDNGTGMQHNHLDGDNGKHCNVDNCLMYFAIETNQVFSLLGGGEIPELDAFCREDLRANGGR